MLLALEPLLSRTSLCYKVLRARNSAKPTTSIDWGLRMSPKVKLGLNILATFVSAGAWIPFWIGIEIYKKWHASEVVKFQRSELIKKTKFEISEIEESLLHHSALDKSLENLGSVFPSKGVLIKIIDTRLYESRVGASITSTSGSLQAQTKTGSVGIGTNLGPVGVGLGASKGETRGTINSSSVTRSGKDEMTKIDEGDLILSTDSISFAGQQFSRSVNFEDLLNYQVSRNEILVSSKNSDKNWLVAFNSDAVTSALGQIIELISSTTDPTLLKSKSSSLLLALRKTNLEDSQLFQEELTRKQNQLLEIETRVQ